MRVLLDTNIVLDVLLARQPWLDDAKTIWQAHVDGRIVCCITATTVTNIFYIAKRMVGIERARLAARLCIGTFELLAVGRFALETADKNPGKDLEDNLQTACAM